MLFGRLVRHVVRVGRLTVIDANGGVHEFGEPGSNIPDVAVRLHERSLHHKLFYHPTLHLGEAYMDGTLTIEQGSLPDLLELLGRNISRFDAHPLHKLLARIALPLRRYVQRNKIRRARANVAHHYDLSGELYDLFLDDDRQYSCAYFAAPDDSLDTAQLNKKRHIAAKLCLDQPGLKILDIGSGWGGLGIYLAEVANASVTGVTLSTEQHGYSMRRVADAGMTDRVSFQLRDYREVDGRFDRIVSVGMFEHVGVGYYRAFFEKVRDLLADDGVALLHSIGTIEPPRIGNPWIRKYIFPGGNIPSLSEVFKAVEQAGLWVTDMEILRLHYAETLRHWYDRFQANRDRAREIYDERFCRMWEFYLSSCEMGFRHWGMMVFQLQLSRHQTAVPLVRDYVTDWERGRDNKIELDMAG